jgi:uncharacterized protein (UPF0264 family)
MSKLVVSVRSGEEVEAALNGGADLIDVKEPQRGSLGRAEPRVIREILELVGGRVPVSAALGEWYERNPLLDAEIFRLPLHFIKWGLSGCGSTVPPEMLEHRRELHPQTTLVLVAYADWRIADCPPPERMLEFAAEHGIATVLFDTFDKSAGTLLSHLQRSELATLMMNARDLKRSVVLAGSLSRQEITDWASLAPDWFAIRSAACEGGRLGWVSETRVRAIREVLKGAPLGLKTHPS